jgi:hypothetical protein
VRNLNFNLKISDSRQSTKDDHSVEELAVVPTHPVRGGKDQNTVANSKVERFPDTFEAERCEASENRKPKPATTWTWMVLLRIP